MKKIILGLLLLPFSLLAQINESDTVLFQSQWAASGIYQKGNVDLISVRGKIDFSMRIVPKVVFKSQNNAMYQEFSKFKADEDLYSKNFLYYSPQSKVYPFAMGFVSASYRRKIDLMYFAGLGVTWQAIQHEKHHLKLSVAGVYEQSRFKQTVFNLNEYNGKNTIQTSRVTFYLSGKHQLQPSLTFFYDAYAQPSVQHQDNYRLFFDAGLSWQIKPRLSAQMLYLHTYERVVVRNVKSTDAILTFGLNYNIKTNFNSKK